MPNPTEKSLPTIDIDYMVGPNKNTIRWVQENTFTYTYFIG